MTLDRQPTLASELLLVRPLGRDDFEALWAISSDPLLWEQHPAKERAERTGFDPHGRGENVVYRLSAQQWGDGTT